MKKVFSSNDWKHFSKWEISRAQVLLVAKGLKKGTIVSGYPGPAKRTLSQLGLSFEEHGKKIQGMKTYTVARKKDLEKYQKEQTQGKKNAHQVQGNFLSYPTCCIKEYARKRTVKEQEAQKQGKLHLTYKLGRQLTALGKRKRSYPDYLNYCPPSFTPCRVHCSKTKKLLLSWKKALLQQDPKAAEALKHFNQEQNLESFYQNP